MKSKDIIPIFIVMILLLSFIYYEYKVSIQQIPAAGNNAAGKALYKGVSSKELSEMMKMNNNLSIIDVRNEGDFNDGHIPGAISIEYPKVEEKLKNYDKNDLIIIYCESGPWSRLTYEKLKKKGFHNIKILINGLVGWKWEINGEIEQN